jgi:YkoY family integral membrane protein
MAGIAVFAAPFASSHTLPMLDQLINSPFAATVKTPLMLLVLIALEAVLSADNAIALATIAQGLPNPEQQRRALNAGLIIAYILRILLIVTASFVLRYWQFELAGALYLLWLVGSYFLSPEDEGHHHKNFEFSSFWQAIPFIAFTDLAFSLDSVTTAIAVADDLWLIIAGGTIGVITLRFLAGLFIRWLDIFAHLKDAGFITVGLVGIRLLVRVINPDLVPPELLMITIISLLFAWGFSERRPEIATVTNEITKVLEE